MQNIAKVDKADRLWFFCVSKEKSSSQTLNCLIWISFHPPIEGSKIVRAPAGFVLDWKIKNILD